MKILFVLTLIAIVLFPIMGNAATLEWNRNTETDMSKYHVYLCRVENCTATDQGQMWAATVAQPALGIKPKFVLPDNTIGAAAVVAEDTTGLISGPSISLPFTTVSAPINLAPLSPSGLLLKP